MPHLILDYILPKFDFDEITLFSLFNINLKKGQAAKIGASSGLGSEGNVENAKRDKKAFFNWSKCCRRCLFQCDGAGIIPTMKRRVSPSLTFLRCFVLLVSADETIATARGGGGGLALWKRVVEP